MKAVVWIEIPLFFFQAFVYFWSLLCWLWIKHCEVTRALEVMPPIACCGSMASEVAVCDMAVEVELSLWYSIRCHCCMLAAEGQSDMGVWMKQRGVFEFLCEEKVVPAVIHQCLLIVYEDQTLDVMQWSNRCVLAVGHLHWCRFLQHGMQALFIAGENA